MAITPMASWSWTPALVLLATYGVYAILYGFFLSPLRHIPGPWHTKFTSAASLAANFTGKGAKSVEELHQRYGPVVRVSPTVASVTGEEAIRTIYGGPRPYAKDDRLARLFSMCRPEHPNVAGIQDASSALKRRRVIGTAFSTKFLSDNEPIFTEVAKGLVNKIDTEQSKGPGSVDILHAYRRCATEVIVQIAFGGCFVPSAGDPVELLDDALLAQFVYMLSTTAYRFMRLLPRFFPFIFGCDKLAQVARDSIANCSKDPSRVPGRKDCLGPMLIAKEEGSEKALPLESIVSETMVFLFAGVDSTANTATYVTWELARRPEVQTRLRAELHQAFPTGLDAANSRSLAGLRYMNGVIAEALRLHAPFPGLGTRKCPKSGQDFHGYFVPEGVSVGVQQWSIGRDPKQYPDPDRFDPARWDLDEVQYNKQIESMMAFSAGPRVCIGKQMAMTEIRHFIATLLLTYKSLRPSIETTESSMEEYEAGLTVPKSGKCVLVFERS